MILLWVLGGIVAIFGLTVFLGAPYVPSHRRQVRRAFTKLRPLHKDDVVVDLGSGDGVVLRQAMLLGAKKAIGYELNPILVMISRMLSLHMRPCIRIYMTNMWQVMPPQDVTVVYVFGVGRDMSRLAVMLQKWATDLDRPIQCIVYGHDLAGQVPVTSEGAHKLYEYTPLRNQQAQV